MRPDAIVVNIGALVLIVGIVWYFWISDSR